MNAEIVVPQYYQKLLPMQHKMLKLRSSNN